MLKELYKYFLEITKMYLWNKYFLLLVWDRYVTIIIVTAKQLENQN